ncbi:MAG: hypothetical protein C0501_06815 [Isosphaera sp.]|nr:hypothetical protein [Isosphaera sp.]
MSDEPALLAAIAAAPDEDTPRLAYADWLDENRPDPGPSPAAGPSARAEFVRAQCRLAAAAADDPDYPDLLERAADLAAWLNTHDPAPDPAFPGLFAEPYYGTGEWADFRRGFLEVVSFDDYGDDPAETVEVLAGELAAAFARSPARTLQLEDATAEEVALLARHPVFAHVRGLYLDSYLGDGDEDEAVAAVAASPHAAGLRRLYLDIPVGAAGCRALARSRRLAGLESLALDYPVDPDAVREFRGSRWFRDLRRLHLWAGGGDNLRVLADFPPMPRLAALVLRGVVAPGAGAAVRRFAAGPAFPRLSHLDLSGARLTAEHVALLARARWPLRHLDLSGCEVRKAGAEALAAAGFAPTLRVLELRECEITAGGAAALADSVPLGGLRRLDLSGNPLGPGGLAAVAAGRAFRRLTALSVGRTNTTRAPVAARDVLAFLSATGTPDLRHLDLTALPVAVRGARVLASSPAFARLTRLVLNGCGLGERGTAAVLGSKGLTDLVVLDLGGNKVGAAAGRLADPKVCPRLGLAHLGAGVPKAARRRLARRRGVVL